MVVLYVQNTSVQSVPACFLNQTNQLLLFLARKTLERKVHRILSVLTLAAAWVFWQLHLSDAKFYRNLVIYRMNPKL